LQVELMAFLMKAFELFSGLVKLNLGGLCFRYFLLELFALVAHLNGKLFDLESKFLDLGLVCSAVLLKSQVVLFLLASSECPLFELLLIPVHFKFELVHALVGFKDHILDIIKTILLVRNALLQLFNFIFKATRLALCNLLHVFFGFNFLVFCINKTLGVNKLHLYGLQMFSQNLEAFLVLLYLESKLSN